MAIVGSAYVEIHTVTRSVADEIRNSLRDAMNGRGTESGRTFGEEFSKQVKDSVGKSTNETTRDTVKQYASAGDESGKQFSNRFSSIVDKIKAKVIKPPVDTTELEIKIARAEMRLRELGAMEANPKVDLDIRQTEYALARLRTQLAAAQDGGNIHLKVEDKSLRDSIVSAATLSRALSILALPVAILGATPYLVSLASSLVQVSGAAGVAGAGLLGLIGIVATAVIGFQNFGTALGPTGTEAQLKKVNEAMAKLSPTARETVTTIRGLGDEWKSVSSVVQNRMFEGVGAQIAVLATAWIPMLRGQLGGMASEIGQLANQTMAWLSSGTAVAGWGTILGNTTLSLNNMGTVGSSVLRIITAIGVVGSNFLPGLATSFANAADRAADFLEKAKESGKLGEWMQNGLNVMRELYQLVINLSSILGSMFTAVNQTGEPFLTLLVRITGQMAAFFKSAEGQAGLIEFFTGIRTVVETVIPKLMEFGPVIAELGRAFVALFTAAAPFSGALASVLIPAMIAFLQVVQALAPVLGPLLVLFVTYATTMRLVGAAIAVAEAAHAGYAITMAALTGATTTATVAQNANRVAVLAGNAAAILVRGAVIAWTGAQWLLNAALAANPITLVVIAIAALVAGLVLAYQHSETFRNIVTGAFNAVKNAVQAVIDFFTGPFVDAITSAFTTAVEWVTGLPGRISDALSSLGTSIAEGARAAWNWLVTAAEAAGEGISNFLTNLPQKIAFGLGFLAGALARQAIDAWNAFTGGLETAWNATYAFVTSLPERIITGLVSLAISLYTSGTVAMDKFTEGITNAWDRTYAFVTSLPGRILAGLISLGLSLYQSGSDAWARFQAAFDSAVDTTIAWFQALPGRIIATLVSLGLALYKSGTDAITGFQNGIVNAYNAVIAWFVALPGNIANFFTNAGTWLWQTGADIINGLIEGLKSAWNAVWSWVTGIIDSFIAGFKAGFGIASPSTIFMSIGTDILTGLLNGLISMVEAIMGFIGGFIDRVILGFQRLLDFWKTVWDAVLTYATTVWQAFVTFMQSAISAFVDLFSTLITGLYTLWQSIWSSIQTFATTIWNAISAFFTAAFTAYRDLFMAVFNAVKAFWESIWNAIKAFGEALWNALVAFYNSGFTNWRGLFEAVMNAINAFWQMIWNAIRAFGEQIWNAIAAFFQAGLNAFRALIESVMNAISAFWSSIWTAIRTYAETVWNAFANFFNAAINAFRQLIETVMNAISAFWSTIWNAIRTVGETIWNGFRSFIETGIRGFQTFWETTWNAIRDTFGRVFGGIKDIATQIWNDVKGIFRTGLNAIINGVNWPIEKINGLFSISIPTIPQVNLATGGDISGKVRGTGGRTADRVPAMLSYDEHVWSAKEVDRAGGHAGVRKLRELARAGMLDGLADGGVVTRRAIPDLKPGAFIVNDTVADQSRRFLEALNRGQTEAVQATGGRFARGPQGFAAGGALQNAINFARSQHGKPYIWGGVGPAGYDCSGFQSAITNVLRGQGPHRRLGNTDTMPWGGFVNGLVSAYGVGNRRGNPGHMAGTLMGNNVEAGGSPSMTKFVQNAAGVGSFPNKYSLPEVGGQFVGGGGIFDPAAWFDFLARGLRALAEAAIRGIIPDVPSFMEPMGLSLFGKAWDGLRNTAIKLISSIFGGVDAGVPASTGPVQEQVRSIARQYGWDSGAQWDAIVRIVQKESGWNPNAANPNSSARGLFQKMTSIHGAVEPTAGGQASWGLNYIKSRYGTPAAALAYHNRVGHYDRGGWLPPGITQAINGTGKPEAIIADPMTTFEKSFRKVFRWLSPSVSRAISGSIDNLDEVVMRMGGEEKFERAFRRAYSYMPRWAQQLVNERFPQIVDAIKSPELDLVNAIQDTFTPPPPPVIPPPVIELPPEQPPIITPEMPTGEIRASFEEALSRFAPELGLSIKAGAASGIREYGGQVLANQDRMQTIADAMGTPLADVKSILAKLVDSAAEVIPQPPPLPPRPPEPKPTWLEREVERLRQYALANLNRGNSAEWRIEQLGDRDWRLVRAFEQAFPDIDRAMSSSRIDVNRTLAARASDILAFVNQLDPDDAVALLSALDGQKRSLDDFIRWQAKLAEEAATEAKSTTLTFADGAFTVNINGNADSVTVDQLQTTLEDWGQEILHQYEGRT